MDADVLVVIPTRNRASLACRAINSVLSEGPTVATILVSDNSTDPEEAESLRAFCAQQKERRLLYARPPSSLAMSAHWQWAIERGLSASAASHVIYLTDRMMFKPGGLTGLGRIAAVHPDQIVSYNHDRIIDDQQPVAVQKYPGTMNLVELRSSTLREMYSQGLFHPAFPKMLNCVVPRGIFQQLIQRFGSVFSSVAPDYNFCCRVLDTVQSLVFFDWSPSFHYALARSNGASISRGKQTADSIDFFANIPEANAAKAEEDVLTSFATVGSTILHEYVKFRNEHPESHFPPLDEPACLRVLGAELDGVTIPEVRHELRRRLLARGWSPGEAPSANGRRRTNRLRNLLSFSAVSYKIRALLVGPSTKPAWTFMAKRFGVRLPFDCRFEFDQTAEAIDFLMSFADRPAQSWAEDEARRRGGVLLGKPP